MIGTGTRRNQNKKEQEGAYERSTKMLLQFEEEERKTIAREIHDDLSQPLTAIKISLSGLLKKIPQENSPLLEK